MARDFRHGAQHTRVDDVAVPEIVDHGCAERPKLGVFVDGVHGLEHDRARAVPVAGAWPRWLPTEPQPVDVRPTLAPAPDLDSPGSAASSLSTRLRPPAFAR